MATRTCFYPEDNVALKEDSSVIAIVESSWRDVDAAGSIGKPDDDWINHRQVTAKALRQFIHDGQPPMGHVTIRLVYPHVGTTLVREDNLILLDRGLVTGDPVKRGPQDSQSGMVLKVEELCELEPLYNGLPFSGPISWPYKPEDNRVIVPAEELRNIDLEEGDRIVYRDWVGDITGVAQEITVRLGNGTVVNIYDVELLKTAGYRNKNSSAYDDHRNTLASQVQYMLKQRQKATPTSKNSFMPAHEFWPGQTVFTTKANLRLGTWKIGKYNPNEPPQGVVVDVKTNLIHVGWLATKVFDSTRASLSEPDEIIEGPELEEVRIYNENNRTDPSKCHTNHLGTRRMNDLEAGSAVKFRDVAGAAVKYSADALNAATTGVFRRIPRSMTDGFEMNSFMVRRTKTIGTVEWQDGTITEELAIDLLPYLNVDDHDLWRGEVISLRSAEVTSENDDVIWLHRVGVVQSVDAKERTAQIRWFKNPKVAIFKKRPSILFSGADLGEISETITTESLYDLAEYSALSKRRGDLVVLAPDSVSQALYSAAEIINTSDNGDMPTSPVLQNEAHISSDPQNTLSKTEVRWLGEVIDLTFDGRLLVRLGALDEVEDILVSIPRVNVAFGGDDVDADSVDDDDSQISLDSDEDSEGWSNDMSDEEKFVEETIYEGGERLDDGDEDAWMTDGTEASHNSNAIPIERVRSKSRKPSDSMDLNESYGASREQATQETPDETKNPETVSGSCATGQKGPFDNEITSPTEAQIPAILSLTLSKYPLMPAQFEIVDGAPEKHHYLSSPISLSASFLRRVKNEHDMLSSSLPPGIWARTWSDRLDLLRVLILGPSGTPYALAPFLFDFQFKPDYPQSAPQAFFHSWTDHVGRVNPNLYQDGNVCLSVLGTWHTNEEREGWNREKSSMLQVLVSLLGLVLVEKPYYNEAGFETLSNAEEYLPQAKLYAERALCLSKGFIVHALRDSHGEMDKIIEWIYRDPDGPRLLLHVLEYCRELVASHANPCKDEDDSREKPISAGAVALLKRYLPALEDMAQEAFHGC